MSADAEALGWLGAFASEFGCPRGTRFTSLNGGGLPPSGSADRAQVFAGGQIVIKLHARYTAGADLSARVSALRHPTLAQLFVQPLSGVRVTPDGGLATAWPLVETLSPADPPPWAEAGRALARLHRVPAPTGLPAHGGPARLHRALSRLRSADGAAERLVRTVGADVAERERVVVSPLVAHGDWHLGQLGRPASEPAWRLLDPDDLGVGDAAWDLARPAGFWAAGLLDDVSWSCFLDGYRDAGGPALPDADPWPALETPARAAVVIAAAAALRRGLHSDPTAEALLAACRRMHHGRHEPTDQSAGSAPL